ncbi:MAG TPA: DUF427 domain-containing protein [Actinomycetes bacterium]|nr:DUF427 domain-containing protein [Actinomycetes bacterium]
MRQRTFAEPTGRRIRVRLGATLVADSTRAQLLVQYGRGGMPTYYLPLDDVRGEALADESAGPDGRTRWTVTDGSSRAVGAAWTHPDPTGDLSVLDKHVTFSWTELDWFEEDEQVFVHARDPHKRVDTLRSSRRVEVWVAGELVARSVRPVLLFETGLPTRYYLPFEDVRQELLEASDLITRCPYKGTARYWSVRVGDTLEPDLVWSYPDPVPEIPKIKDLVCFFNERVDLVVDGVPQERPASPWSRSVRTQPR